MGSFSVAPTIQRGGTGTARLSFQLVKTGRITAAELARTPLFGFHTYSYSSGGAYGRVTAETSLLSTPVATAGSCRVTTPNVPAPLATARPAVLTSNGSAPGNDNIVIGLQCDPQSNVYITLTDATTPGNRSDLLTLTSDSTASGVRLRIRNPSGTAISFGPDSSVAGNMNQWQVGQSSGATAIRLSAEYVANGTVQPGTVRALATFTMSYQ
jgi:type 1 fimbria pilin